MITRAAGARLATALLTGSFATGSVVTGGVLSGCSASRPPALRTPSGTQTATGPASEQLQRIAGVAAGVAYTATYRAHQSSPVSTQTWRVWRTTTSIRVDVTTPHAVTTMIVSPRGAYSCRVANHQRTCFRVAKAGQPIPAPFNLAPHAVFSTDVTQLARNAAAYDVQATRSREGTTGIPAATCFAVRPTASAPTPTVNEGTYCLSGNGLITAVMYPSGNTLALTSVTVGPPDPSRFVPYATPTPLPG